MPDLPPPTPMGLTPYLIIRGGRGREAIAFYVRAFDAAARFKGEIVLGDDLTSVTIED